MATQTAPASRYTRANPYPGKLLVNRRLTGIGSAKDTRHLEISLTGWGLNFEVGDSMAVYPSNDPELVEEIITAISAKGDELVPGTKTPTLPLREALLSEYRITSVTPKFLKAIVERAKSAPLIKGLLDPARKQDLDNYLWGMEAIDFLLEHRSARFAPTEFVGLMAKLQPRLYSVASSLKAYPESVHLTVDVVRYESHGRLRKGVCSTFLGERSENVAVPCYPSTSKFRLPEDGDTPIIMVGPGTGVAPFRAFLQERKALSARGKAWLFFGSQHAKTDFFYEEEFAAYQKEGFLTRLDTAFSRDQAEKMYVQHRMKENAAEFWKWLEEGAHFFVCGDARRMAKDVDAALHQIVSQQSGRDTEAAADYVEKLKNEKRYKRDVY